MKFYIGDETTIQVHNEEGRKDTSVSYMWLLASGEDEETKGVVFKYAPSRSGEVAQELIGGYEGILVTDRICSRKMGRV